ncbi:hypothetical protein P7C73_g4714, partial [Tremellales sp. Uapishka_1]
MADESSSRPAAKRIRSDNDHSKATTKNAEEDRNPSDKKDDKDEKNKDNKDTEHKDEDWQAQPPYSVGASKEGWTTKWRSSCWCGKTAFIFDSDPLQSKICHCEDCQRLHGAPFQHSAIFKKDAVRLDSSPEWIGFLSAHGEVHPLSHTPTPLPRKISCRACGSPLFDEGRNMIMSFPPNFEFPRGDIDEHGKSGDATAGHAGGGNHPDTGNAKGKVGMPECFKAQCHIFYGRRCMDIVDGLPKWRRHKDTELMGETEVVGAGKEEKEEKEEK